MPKIKLKDVECHIKPEGSPGLKIRLKGTLVLDGPEEEPRDARGQVAKLAEHLGGEPMAPPTARLHLALKKFLADTAN
jgi:hypothetical protein